MPAAQLDPQASASLSEASVLLQNTTGFMYLPIFAESERAAALALAQLRPAMSGEPYRVAWPAPRAATLDATQQQSELEQDQNQLLAHLDEAIRKLPANAVLVLDASSRARSELALRIASHLNLRREPLRAAQLRFVLLWFAPLREALVAGAPDLWSMRSLSPWADEVDLAIPEKGDVHTMPLAKSADVQTAKTMTQTRQSLQNLRSHISFFDAGLSIQDALALISALHHSNQTADALEVAERLLAELANDATTRSPQHLSSTFIWVSLLRNAMGDSQGALAPAQEAVNICRRLAKTNPAAYEPDLAMSLNNLANRMSDVGDRQGALAPAQEAVSIYRRLVQDNSAVYEPELAGSLNNLANRMSDVGDRQGALAPAQEAVSIRRRLAQANPAAYEPELAGSLNNLANRMSDVRDRQGALAPAQEAVSIYRRLAQANPAAYEPDLAMSLNNLASCISDVGDRQGALASAQEAVSIRRRLAQANPAAYEPDLAMSLGTAMQCFSAANEKEKAKACGEEALALFTRLAAAQPAAFERYKEMVQADFAALLKN